MSSLENALKIVALLSKDRPVLRVGEVCRELDLPKSSVSRLLKTLSAYDIVEREPGDTGYAAGRRALLLADLYTARHNLLDLVDASLDTLTADFQFACYCAVLNGADIIIIRVKHGSYPLRLVQEIGVPMPAYRTSVGRALLARKTDAEVLALVRSHADEADSDEAVLAAIAEVRRTGASATANTVIPGVAALGVAVHDAKRNEMLGFSISYPIAATDEALRSRMLRRIREEAHAIGGRSGDAFWLSHDMSG